MAAVLLVFLIFLTFLKIKVRLVLSRRFAFCVQLLLILLVVARLSNDANDPPNDLKGFLIHTIDIIPTD